MLPMLEWIILGVGLYLVIGAVFAVAFVLVGVARVSPAARGTGLAFRLLIFPGSAVFWPWLAALWVRPAAPPLVLTGIEGLSAHEPLIDPEAETTL
ncbi:MAG: hypothetical protein K8E66_02930 [Phycisphaerales bacterium]|nr:hypothetical protein [Phycisphaerales bacterium]